ncbi:MAG TPA: 50S ribosomal protein L19 [Candidatus Paceibacterota bacterium]|nr:50S ribosomal protein L19 [Candidatus Paceibacterota bacterium]
MAGVITPVAIEERQKLGVRPGDTVRVHQKIVEKGKTRTQTFEGLVLAVKHGTEAGATFTVRATLSGIGVERIFPLYAPFIEKIEIVRRSKVRRAKLYFIREKVAREVRRQLRNMRMMNVSTDDFAQKPEETPVVAEAAPVEEAPAEEVVAAPAEETVAEAEVAAAPTEEAPAAESEEKATA